MDSPKDSPSLRNSVRLNADIERNRNYRSSSLNLRQRDSEILQPSTSNQSGNIVHFNGPQRNHMNSLPGNEGTSQNSRYNENTSERNKNSKTTQHQTQICNNIVDKAHSESDSAVPDNSSAIVNSYDNGVDSQEDTPSCQRHKICTDQAGNSSGNVASTSSGRPTENKDSNFRENRKRPSSLKLNRVEDDSSSDTGNDDYSLGSEDGCIYTYRGGEHLADLPSSFFSLDMGLPLDHHLPLPNYPVPQAGAAPLREQGSRASSPDMEFLEMDFDPGPSCEVDSGDESSPDVDLEIAGNMVEEIQPAIIRGTSPEYVPSATLPNPISFATATAPGSRGDSNDLYSFSVPSTSHSTATGPTEVSEITTSYSFGQFITHVNTRGEELLVRRTMAHGHVNVPISLHIACGDLVTPREMLNLEEEPHGYQINQGSTLDSVNLSSAVYHVTMAKKLTAEKANSEVEAQAVAKSGETSCNVTVETGMRSATSVALPRCMIWSESEACERQVTQIATSACGATAVVNVFNALGVPVNLERINSAVGTRQRANNAPLARYLLSRAVAGCTAADLVSGIHRASDGLVTARFFPTYPERAVSLSLWLADWITLGAVPILTLNLQAGYEGEMPDAWHHQMVFGVWARRIYLCNPVESIRENVLWPRLISPSVLLVRSRDVLSRFTVETDLTPLAVVPDQRFHTFNVLGQVANVIREYRATGWGNYGTRTRHIQIPAAYQAGVTIAALTGSEAHRRLVSAAQLPIITASTDP